MEKRDVKQMKKGMETLQKLQDKYETEEIIKDNKIVFEHKNDTYKVKLPNIEEQSKIDSYTRKKKIEFLKDPDMLFKKEWVKLLSKKGIDIEEIDNQIRDCLKKRKNKLLILAKASSEKEINELEKSITELENKAQDLSIEKTDYLSSSIECQLRMESDNYTVYTVLEKKNKDGKWEKVFSSYSDFLKSEDTSLIAKAYYYVNHLVYKDPEA